MLVDEGARRGSRLPVGQRRLPRADRRLHRRRHLRRPEAQRSTSTRSASASRAPRRSTAPRWWAADAACPRPPRVRPEPTMTATSDHLTTLPERRERTELIVAPAPGDAARLARAVRQARRGRRAGRAAQDDRPAAAGAARRHRRLPVAVGDARAAGRDLARRDPGPGAGVEPGAACCSRSTGPTRQKAAAFYERQEARNAELIAEGKASRGQAARLHRPPDLHRPDRRPA